MIAYLGYIDEKDDVAGEDYHDLIDTCFKYAKYFSLVNSRGYSKGVAEKYYYIYDALKPYLVSSSRPKVCPIGVMFGGSAVYNVYKCCEETKQLLKNECDLLYSWWEGRPEDLTFYYEDKHVLLCTLTHECECTLSCTDDVYQDFHRFGRWHYEDKTGFLDKIYF